MVKRNLSMSRTGVVTLVYHLVALTLCAYYLYRAELVFGHPNAKLLAFGGRYPSSPFIMNTCTSTPLPRDDGDDDVGMPS